MATADSIRTRSAICRSPSARMFPLSSPDGSKGKWSEDCWPKIGWKRCAKTTLLLVAGSVDQREPDKRKAQDGGAMKWVVLCDRESASKSATKLPCKVVLHFSTRKPSSLTYISISASQKWFSANIGTHRHDRTSLGQREVSLEVCVQPVASSDMIIDVTNERFSATLFWLFSQATKQLTCTYSSIWLW